MIFPLGLTLGRSRWPNLALENFGMLCHRNFRNCLKRRRNACERLVNLTENFVGLLVFHSESASSRGCAKDSTVYVKAIQRAML